MSAQWMKGNGMHRTSTPAELDRRETFAPALGKPTPAEYRRAYAQSRQPFLNWWTRLRIRIFGQRFESTATKEMLARLPMVELTRREDKFAGRWTPDYVKMLGRTATKHVRLIGRCVQFLLPSRWDRK